MNKKLLELLDKINCEKGRCKEFCRKRRTGQGAGGEG